MRFFLAFVLVLASGAARADAVDTYVAARDTAIADLKKMPAEDPKRDAKNTASRAALETQVKAIVGPVSLPGFKPGGKSNLETLDEEPGFGKLDGMAYTKAKPETVAVVTTEALLKRWLEAHATGDACCVVPRDVPAALGAEQFYTSAISSDAAIAKFAILPIVTPAEASTAIAMVGQRTQDIAAGVPDQILLSVIRSGRVVVAIQQIAKKIAPIAACDAIARHYQVKGDQIMATYRAKGAKDEALFDSYTKLQAEGDTENRACFARSFKDQASYAATFKQAQGLVDQLK